LFKIGVDIVSVKRIRDNIEQHGDAYLHKIFTSDEIAYCTTKAKPALYFAGTFAAKEAVWKALQLPGDSEVLWKEIEIGHIPQKSPNVILDYKVKELLEKKLEPYKLNLSISHCDDYAVAMAIVVPV
jgi:holo-[acyl-carrier protein] synthase